MDGENSELHALFPTPVMIARQAVSDPDLDQLRERARDSARLENSHDSLLGHSSVSEPASITGFETVAPILYELIVSFGEQLLGERLSWHMKEAWFNRMLPGGLQAMHVHANSLVSGVLYLTDSHPSANIIFERGTGGGQFILSNFHADSAVTPYNAARWQAQDIKAGDLVLFPSYMMHGVQTNKGGERICLSFNAIPEKLNAWGYALKLSPADP